MDPPSKLGGKSLEQWIREIKHRDPSVRETAIRTVPFFGKRSREAAPALIGALLDRDASCRVHATLSLAGMSGVLKDDEIVAAVRALGERVNKDVQGIVRFHAAVALAKFGKDSRPAIPNLINQVRDQVSWEIRRAAVVALSAAGKGDERTPPDSQAIYAIAGIFLNPSGYEESAKVRLEAAIALGAMGRPADGADMSRSKQALQRAIKDTDKTVGIWAYAALMAIDYVTPEGLNAIAKHFKGNDVNAKIEAARALAAIGRDARSKVPEVAELLSDSELFVVAGAIVALGEFGPHANSAVPALTRVMEKKDQNAYIKELAKSALEQIQSNEKPKK
jgi:HEAT repeat protein